jgi:hypothetical protein
MAKCTKFLVEMQPLITRLNKLEEEPPTLNNKVTIQDLEKQIQALWIDYAACLKIRPEPPRPPL